MEAVYKKCARWWLTITHQPEFSVERKQLVFVCPILDEAVIKVELIMPFSNKNSIVFKKSVGFMDG